MNPRWIVVLVAAMTLHVSVNTAADVVYVDLPDTVLTFAAPYTTPLLEIDLDRDGRWDYELVGFVEAGHRHIVLWGYDGENFVATGDYCCIDTRAFAWGFGAGDAITLESYESYGWWQVGELLTDQGEGEWARGETLYLGFYWRFGRYALGWIRIRALPSAPEGALSIVVYDYAYENEHNTPIRAGEGTVSIQRTTWSTVKQLYRSLRRFEGTVE